MFFVDLVVNTSRAESVPAGCVLVYAPPRLTQHLKPISNAPTLSHLGCLCQDYACDVVHKYGETLAEVTAVDGKISRTHKAISILSRLHV
jgi:hypothetical protein